MEYNLLDDEILQNAFLDDDPASDYKARQGNYVDDEDGEDYSLDSPYEPVDTSNAEDMPGAFTEKQQTQQVEQKPVVTSMLDLVRKTEPKQDKDIIQKTKKAALLDAVGSVLGSLAGAAGTAAGASVPILPDNQNLKTFYSIADNEKNKYKALKRDWDNKMLQASMADAQQELANKRLQQQLEIEKYKQEMANRKWAMQFDQNERKIAGDNEYRAKSLASRDNYQRNQIAIDAARLNKESESERKQNEFFTWRNPYTGRDENPYDRTRTAMSRSEFDDAFNDAVYKYEQKIGGKDNLKAFLAQYQNNPIEAKREIVKWYLDVKEQERIAASEAAERRVDAANLDRKVKSGLNTDVRKFWDNLPERKDSPTPIERKNQENTIDFSKLIM